MSVNAEYSPLKAYSGDGSTVAFEGPSTGYIDGETSLAVYVDGDLKTEGTDYSVSSSDGCATATFSSAPASGKEVLLIYVPEYGQETELQNGNPFLAKTLEKALDRLAYQNLYQKARQRLREIGSISVETGAAGTSASVETKVTAEGQQVTITVPRGDKGDKGDTGDTGATGAQGPQGEKGEKGDTGATGPANTLSIGTVTKGENASATITGDAPSQTLNLVLPKGDKGDTGEKGDKGDTGETGPQGPKGDKGDPGSGGGGAQAITVIDPATTAETLADGAYTHVPAGPDAPTYTLPTPSDTTVVHSVCIAVKFTNVISYSFLDANGDAIVPLFTPSITAGDVYEFRCEYSTVQSRWLIYPCKQGAVADDFVMRGEVGAANGVAGLDGNGLVPRVNLPNVGAGTANKGAMCVDSNFAYGLSLVGNGIVGTYAATSTNINDRTNGYRPIVPTILNYAVTAALTDANKIQLTDAQKASAQDTLGVGAAPIVASGAPTTATVGAVGQFAIDTTNHKVYSCEAIANTGTEETPVWEYTWREHVLLDANGKVPNNNLQIIGSNRLGVAMTGGASYGISAAANGLLSVVKAEKSDIDARTSNTKPIVPTTLDYAVRSVLPNMTVIPAATTVWPLADASDGAGGHCMNYRHAPTSAPTYTLPAVADDAQLHEIVLNVRFSATALSADFEDSEGNAITPLSTPTIVAGTVVSFLCRWDALLSTWVIMPVVLGQVGGGGGGSSPSVVVLSSAFSTYAGTYTADGTYGPSNATLYTNGNYGVFHDGTTWKVGELSGSTYYSMLGCYGPSSTDSPVGDWYTEVNPGDPAYFGTVTEATA